MKKKKEIKQEAFVNSICRLSASLTQYAKDNSLIALENFCNGLKIRLNRESINESLHTGRQLLNKAEEHRGAIEALS